STTGAGNCACTPTAPPPPPAPTAGAPTTATAHQHKPPDGAAASTAPKIAATPPSRPKDEAELVLVLTTPTMIPPSVDVRYGESGGGYGGGHRVPGADQEVSRDHRPGRAGPDRRGGPGVRLPWAQWGREDDHAADPARARLRDIRAGLAEREAGAPPRW